MSALRPDVDPEGYLEYSVVYTDRALNHMSSAFQNTMQALSRTLRGVYNAEAAVVVPGSGTFGMEAVARQFAHDKRCLVIRNGWFSYRWSQIFEMGRIPSDATVLKARRIGSTSDSPFVPAPIDEVVATIASESPDLVFAPHVETSAGMILPDDYLSRLAEATHQAGGLLVLDCIASGAIWVDMRNLGVDVLVSAPQKGWSGSPCCALVMLSNLALERITESVSSSFACDLRKWLEIMRAYEKGGHAYHATMPTDSLQALHSVMQENEAVGFETLRSAQLELGQRVRGMLTSRGFRSVAADGFEAPGVVVCYTEDDALKSGQRLLDVGVQIAAGVPLMCDEGDDFRTFRIGLFGLDKLTDVSETVGRLENALNDAGL